MGPKPKIPAWSISKGVWKPLSATTGMNGRAFSRRTAASAASTSARREATSGRLVRAIGIRSSSAPAGVDQGDLDVVVLQRLDHRAGVEPEHLRESALWTRHCCRADDGLLLEVGEHVPGPVDLELWDQVAAQGGDLLDQLVPPLDA